MRPGRQGQPPGSKLDAHEAFILDLIAKAKDIALAEIAERLVNERGVSACPATIWYFFDARWTLKTTKAKPSADGATRIDLAIPAFGYKNHIAIDPQHGLIRNWTVSSAAAHDGDRLEAVLDRNNLASSVWADTAYCSQKNEAMLAHRGFVSQIHRKKPHGKPIPEHVARGHATKSVIRSHVEHVFAHQKGIMGIVVRTIGIARAQVKIGMANLAYNMRRLVFLRARAAPA